jgi:hypothetical protein
MQYRLCTLLIVLAVGPMAFATACSLVTVISPKETTLTAMSETRVRMHLYMLAQRDYPADLQALPVREGYANRVTDGWGRELIYAVDDAGIISLKSLGRDGKAGGKGDDADIIKRYRTRNEDGSLNIDDAFWIAESEIRDAVP